MKKDKRRVRIGETCICIRVHRGYDYDIPISQTKTPQEVCMWLGQIAEKTWGTPTLLGELVLALNEVNGDLRGFK